MKNLVFAVTFVLLLSFSIVIFNPVHAAAGDYWVSRAPMQVARADLGVAAVNGDIYAIGGNTITGTYNLDQGFGCYGVSGGTVNTTEQYDPTTNIWTYKTSMPTPRDSFAIAVYQNEIYCIGGRTTIPLYSPQTFTAANEVYDPTNNTWETKKLPLPAVEWPLQASVVDGKIYVIGHSGATYAYDPNTDSWANKTKAPSVDNQRVTGLVSAVFDNKIYVIGLSGFGSSFTIH